MKELVHERLIRLVSDAGSAYERVLVYATPQRDGTWAGTLEFVSLDGEVLRSGRETTQSALQDVAYWATGLQPTYLEGALARAARRQAAAGGDAAGDEAEEASSPHPATGIVRLEVESLEPQLPLQLMAARTVVPGQRRLVHNGGVIVYGGTRRAPAANKPGVFAFTAQFGSDTAAAILANTLWSALNGRGVTLRVEGTEVPVANAEIKDALVTAVGVRS